MDYVRFISTGFDESDYEVNDRRYTYNWKTETWKSHYDKMVKSELRSLLSFLLSQHNESVSFFKLRKLEIKSIDWTPYKDQIKALIQTIQDWS